ncbi:hypothetical protein AB0F77_33030 [Streptomyces sp. NPDC026672]|uniref:hypothetical protein n=1 Tax=unclassified Streptomyces TaxID=2593676 RepID=UPI00340E61AC
MNRAPLRDLSATTAAALLVVAAVLVGRHLQDTRHTLFVGWPPLFADWHPHLGPGTPAAVLVAAGVVAYGPALAARLPWRVLLVCVWGTAMAWTWSLALVDGWRRGVAGRLTTPNEYLTVVDRFSDVPATLRDFGRHILIQSPDHWPAHIAGHPPAATLTFVGLDRIGLGGGGWAGAWCVTTGASAGVAVLVALRALTAERLARRAAPFLALAPAAVWVGASADGWFAAVAAWAVALLALAVTGRSRWWAAGAGLLFGLTCYLSYGLTLMALVGAAVLLLGRGRLGALPFLLAGTAVVPALFTWAGFDWWEAYRLLEVRYYQGVGGIRPYAYWVWADLACLVFVTGAATAAGVGRVVREWRAVPGRRPAGWPPRVRLALLVSAALLAVLAADLSGLSKAETERIWLPFAMWLLPACALLPRPRAWLTAQAVLALLVNHLLLTGW